MPTRSRLLLLAVLSAAAGLAGWAGYQRTPTKKWNVLIIVADTVRADHLSINGYTRPTTPHLDALAHEGANFRQAITAAPRTWQSFTTILTGLYPPHHGVRFIHDYPLAADVPSIGTLLREHGYATHAFDRMHFLRNMTGGRAFDGYDEAVVSDRGVVETAWEWIATPRPQPFLAFIRLNGAHWPYGASPEEVADFDSCDGKDHAFNNVNWRKMGLRPAKLGEGMTMIDAEAYRRTFFTVDFDEATLRHIIAHYDAEVRKTDADIGWLLDRLREAGLLEQTVVVVTADHGESFGEHGYLQHGPRVDDPVMRVPLIVRLPKDHPSARPGRAIDGQVRTVDIVPTVLDAVGKAPPQALDGVSLLPAIAGGVLPELWAYAESEKDFIGGDPEYYVDGVQGTHRMVRTDGWKLVYIPKPNAPEIRLYDLRTDPGETTNVADRHPDRVRELRVRLEGILVADRNRPSRETELTDAEKEQLHKLGYM